MEMYDQQVDTLGRVALWLGLVIIYDTAVLIAYFLIE